MLKEDRNNEAAIHFELYRFIKNNLSDSNSPTVQYANVEPEKIVKNGSVDLVIEVRKENRVFPFLAVEVKKPAGRSFWLYAANSRNQIERYARELKSPYSALTDGEVLRLFKLEETTNEYTHLGDYLFSLNDECINYFLAELLKLHENNKHTLGIPKAPSFNMNKFDREISGLAKTLVDVFEQLGQEEGFQLRLNSREKTIEKSISFGSFQKVLRLTVEREKKEISEDTSFLYLELSELRKRLGTENLYELLISLKKIPCFNWIEPEKAERDLGSTWKNLRDITIKEEPKPEELKKQLKEWFLELC